MAAGKFPDRVRVWESIGLTAEEGECEPSAITSLQPVNVSAVTAIATTMSDRQAGREKRKLLREKVGLVAETRFIENMRSDLAYEKLGGPSLRSCRNFRLELVTTLDDDRTYSLSEVHGPSERAKLIERKCGEMNRLAGCAVRDVFFSQH